MSFVILCAFVAFFFYLGSRLWSRPNGMNPQMAGGAPTIHPMATDTGGTSYRNADTSVLHESQPRSTSGGGSMSNTAA
jgi:hypothetical protein